MGNIKLFAALSFAGVSFAFSGCLKQT